MLKREDFVFCIGYQGEAAVVDSAARKRYKGCTVQQLLDDGLFRAAFSAAIYDGSEKDMKRVIDVYSKKIGIPIDDVETMKRLLGIFSVPEDISKVMAV
ncbi:MAG: hypothetical protein K9K78_06355 [Spirochaetales bacterium]|nr:hypothetical protein [Spirochaetales bacterium]